MSGAPVRPQDGFALPSHRTPTTKATAFPVLFSASPANVARYKNPEMDQALNDGRSGANPEARKAAYAKVQALTRRDVPFIVGSVGTVSLLASPKLCGMSAVGGFPARTAGIGNC